MSVGKASHVSCAVLYVPSAQVTAAAGVSLGGVASVPAGGVLAGSELLEQASWRTPEARQAIQGCGRIGVSFG